jgi:hypothetical protein
VVVRGAGGPLGRFFFGASEKSSLISARFACDCFVVPRLLFRLLPAFAMTAPPVSVPQGEFYHW